MRILLQLSKYHIKVTKILPISSEKSVLSLSASRGRAASRISAHQHRQTDHITQLRAAVLNGEGGTEGRKSASRAAVWFCDSLPLLRSLSINTINTYSFLGHHVVSHALSYAVYFSYSIHPKNWPRYKTWVSTAEVRFLLLCLSTLE